MQRTLVENWLSLPTKTSLLRIITPLSLRIQRILPFLVLGHLVQAMFPAFLRDAKGFARLWDDNLSAAKVPKDVDDGNFTRACNMYCQVRITTHND